MLKNFSLKLFTSIHVYFVYLIYVSVLGLCLFFRNIIHNISVFSDGDGQPNSRCTTKLL